jgi:hypothetical protein
MKWCGDLTEIPTGAACRNLGVVQSMGRVGSALDNPAAESFFSTLEHELLSRRQFATRAEARALRAVRTRLTDPRAAATADLWLFRLAENRSRLMGLRKEADHAGSSRGSTSRARAHGRPGRPLGGDCRGTRRRRRTSVRRPVRRRTHRRRLPRSGCGRRASTGVICRTRARPLRSGIELDAAIASRRAPACLPPASLTGRGRPDAAKERVRGLATAQPMHSHQRETFWVKLRVGVPWSVVGPCIAEWGWSRQRVIGL